MKFKFLDLLRKNFIFAVTVASEEEEEEY